MQPHLSVTPTGDLVLDPQLPHFSPEEQEWRDLHFGLTVPDHHFATADTRLAMANVVDGWDISSYQPAGPDFRGGGRRVAAFKATEGTSYFDPHFNANRAAAHSEPELVAIIMYHFARPASHSGGDEARYMLSKIGPRRDREIVALDYETSPWSVQFILDFFHVIATEGGYPEEFYSYLGMISANPTSGIPQTGCGLWPAAYGTREPGSDRWAQKDGWQHTDGSGSVPGNDGPWDCSHWDALALATRAGGSPPPPPPPPPPPNTQEEPVGAYALPVLEPGQTYTFRPPPAQGSGGIHFGAVYFSFGCDFVPDPGVPLRIAIYDRNAKAWWVPYGGGHFDEQTGAWVNDTDSIPPLWIATGGDVAAVQMDANHTKVSIAHCGKAGRVVPLVEYQT